MDRTENVGFALREAFRAIERANERRLYGIFGDAQWTNKDRLPDRLLRKLLDHFDRLSLGNAHVREDVMGQAYEYLIKRFADQSNKKAGEFYTPRSVVRLMVNVLDPQPGESVYDPACGTGGMLLEDAPPRPRGRRRVADAPHPWAGEEPDDAVASRG